MVRTREEIMSAIQTRLGEDHSDEAISLLEDITDTLGDYESRITQNGDWKQKYEQNDAEWRQKYTDRFYGGNPSPDAGSGVDTLQVTEEVVVEDEPTTFDDLFTYE